jgi:two-component system response regulator HydG
MQVKLLRVLQDGSFERVGSSRTIQADVRVIAATNRDLESQVKNGQFRQDLFYRLNVITIEVPPLRDRADDIPLLAQFFLSKYNEANQKKIEGFSEEVMGVLGRFPWPGNVRELENIIERAVSLCQGKRIDLADLPPRLTGVSEAAGQVMIPVGLPLDKIEQIVIQKTLVKTRGDKKAAANMLGISLSSLYNKLSRKET